MEEQPDMVNHMILPVDPTSTKRSRSSCWGFVGGFAAVAIACGGIAYATSADDKANGMSQAVPGQTATFEEMPLALEKAARAGFKDSGDLGDVKFEALDSAGTQLSTERFDDAELMSVSFGTDGSHTWMLFVGGSDDGGDPSSVGCGKSLADSIIKCEISDAPDGGRDVSTVLVTLRRPDLGPNMYVTTDASKLTADDLPNLRFSRVVRAFHPGGGMTSSTESVFEPKSLNPDEVFPTSDRKVLEMVNDPKVAGLPKR